MKLGEMQILTVEKAVPFGVYLVGEDPEEGHVLLPRSQVPAGTAPGDELEVVCWQMRPAGPERLATQSLVIKEPDENAYLRLATVDRITHGSSGSPVMRDGKVYGVLTMGRDHVESAGMAPLRRQLEQNTCWAFKASRVRSFLP